MKKKKLDYLRFYHKTIIVLWMLMVPFLLVGLVMESSLVQTRLATFGANWLSKKIGSEVEIQKVSISLFSGVELHSVYLADEKNDTLAFIKSLSAMPNILQLSAEKVELSTVYIDGVVCNLYEKKDSTLNFQFLLDAFAFAEEVDTAVIAAQFTLVCDNFKLLNTSFTYKALNADTIPGGMNFSDIDISDLNLNIKEFVLINDSINLQISRLSMKEKCGLFIDSIETFKSSISSNGVFMDSLLFKTNNSRLVCDSLNLDYVGWDSFFDFLNKVDIQTAINDTSSFCFKDLAYFVPDLKMLDQTIGLSGSVQGAVSALKTDKLTVTYGNNTKVVLTSTVSGLPDIDQLSFDITVNELTSSQSDISSLKFQTDSSLITVPIPEQLNGMGNLSYRGRTYGTTYNFKSDGKLKSNLGGITTLIRAKKDSAGNFNIKGNLSGEHLKIGKILGNEEEFGDLTFNQNIDFTLLSNNKIKLKAVGNIDNIILKKYQYTNIENYVSMEDMNFDSISLHINGTDLKLDFRGRVDLSKDIPEYKFALAIPHADLNALHLEKADTASLLSFAIETDMIGDSPDNITGELKLVKEFKYVKNSLKVNLKTLSIKSTNEANAENIIQKKIKLDSDFIDGEIIGRFKFESLAKSAEYMASSFLPVIAGKKIEAFENPADKAENAGVFTFSFKLKNMETLFDVFVPELEMPNGALIKGAYNALSDTFGILIEAPILNYSSTKLSVFEFKSHSDKKTLQTHVGFKKMMQGEDPFFENFLVGIETRNDSSAISIKWDNKTDSAIYKADIKNTTVLLRDTVSKKLQLLSKFHDSELILSDSVWRISESEIFIDSSAIHVTGFKLSSGNQEVSAFGSIADTEGACLFLKLVDFELASLAPIIGNSIKLKGKLTGNTRLAHLYKTPLIVTHDTINSLEVDDIKLGEVSIRSTWDSDKEGLSLEAYILTEDVTSSTKTDSIGLSGSYYPETNKIDFITEVKGFHLLNFESYFKDYISMKRTTNMDATFKISGTTSEPVISGDIDIKQAVIIVKETGVKYNVDGSLKAYIDNDIIELKRLLLTSGIIESKAVVKGSISHKTFSDFYLNIRMDSIENFQLLNTTATDTSSFYGTVIGDGDVTIKGPPDDLEINVSLITKDHTKLFVSMASSSSVSEDGNLMIFKKKEEQLDNFADSTSAKPDAVPKKTSLSGMKINIDLVATPGAELQVIMDETTGDIMKVKGNGDMKLTINTLGDMELSGIYTITEGDYLFTMKNLISKHFSIEKGGSIKWQGDPYDAELNLNAVYSLKKTSLYNLMLEEEYRNAKTKAECRISMSGMLSSPELKFGIKLPPANDAVNTQIKNLDPDIINKQFLSLLLLNTFQPLPGLSQESVGGSPINTGEVVTNQLNHWLSQMSGGIDVGVNYQTGDEVTTDEFDVELSTQLWDDRVTINGNLGVGGNSDVNPGGDASGAEPGAGAGEKGGNASGLVGDVEIEVKLNQSGSMKMKVFNQSNSDVSYDKGPYTQGVGVFWRKEFNTLLFWKKKK